MNFIDLIPSLFNLSVLPFCFSLALLHLVSVCINYEINRFAKSFPISVTSRKWKIGEILCSNRYKKHVRLRELPRLCMLV